MESTCPGHGQQFILEPPYGYLVKPMPLPHIDDEADFENLPQDEADGTGRPCILLDLNYALYWADWQDSKDRGERLEGKSPDDFCRLAGRSLRVQPHALLLELSSYSDSFLAQQCGR